MKKMFLIATMAISFCMFGVKNTPVIANAEENSVVEVVEEPNEDELIANAEESMKEIITYVISLCPSAISILSIVASCIILLKKVGKIKDDVNTAEKKATEKVTKLIESNKKLSNENIALRKDIKDLTDTVRKIRR